MYQQITLVGNLGSDPEMKYTPSGVPVTKFSVAVNKSWTGQDGTSQKKTTWFRVTVWRAQAENCAKYLAKGRQVLVVGEIEDPYVFTDQDGTPKASMQVTAQNVKFIGGRSDGDYAGSNYGAASSNGEPVNEAGSDEDIPF